MQTWASFLFQKGCVSSRFILRDSKLSLGVNAALPGVNTSEQDTTAKVCGWQQSFTAVYINSLTNDNRLPLQARQIYNDALMSTLPC